MSGQISDDKIELVRDRTDIVEVVSQYVALKVSGRNRMGLCPFHAEKTPSFSVNAERQFYHCFGCGAGGDAFSFLMQSEGLSFPDAVRRLADRAGIDLEERLLSETEKAQLEQRERLFRINSLAADYYHRNLMDHPQGEIARQYLKKRGYGQKTAGEYRIGYALNDWDGLKNHLLYHQVAAEDARALGLLCQGKTGHGEYDMFRARLMFPIVDLSGRVVAFAGRVLDASKPKYINSPESPVYHKAELLFGLYQARQAIRVSGDALIVEGYFDQLALSRAGFGQSVATCGTALTTEHVRQLKRYAQRVVLLFDQDRAGKQATFRAMTILQQEAVAAVAITLPSGDDPDSFLQREGSEAFQQCLAAARPVMELYMEDTLQGAGYGVEFKVRAVEQVLEKIVPLKSELEQDLYLKELSRRSGIEIALLQKKFAALRQHHQRSRPTSYRNEPLPQEPLAVARPEEQRMATRSQEAAAKVNRTEFTLLRLLLQSAQVRKEFVARGGINLIQHADVMELIRLVLEGGAAAGCEIEAILPDLNDNQRDILAQVRNCDRDEFAENLEQVSADCLHSLEKQALKRRADQLLRDLIPAADARGAADEADRFRAELSQLQLQIKMSPGQKNIKKPQ